MFVLMFGFNLKSMSSALALVAFAVSAVATNAVAADGTGRLSKTSNISRELKCQVTELRDRSFFADVLSEQNPTIEIRFDSVTIGSDLYSANDQEFLQYRDSSLDGKDQSVTLIHGTGNLKYDMKYVDGIGTLVGQFAGDVEKPIANFVCD